MKITIEPLKQVMIDEICIELGMSRAMVRERLGKGLYREVERREYFFQNELAINYDSTDCVEFIEFLGGIDGSLKPYIYGKSAFELPEDELVALLTEMNHGEIDDSECGYSYGFLNLSVGIYREMRPCDFLEMLEEMKAEGVDIEGNEDVENDKRKSEHWATIGIGVKHYYDRIKNKP